MGEGDDARPVRFGALAPDALALAHDFRELVLRFSGLALIVDEIFLEIAELPLAGRVVHQRNQSRRMTGEEVLEEFDDVGRGDLAAQMGLVVGAQQICGARALDRVGQRHDLFADAAAPVLMFVHADAKGIEHGGDAGGGDLRVVGHHRAAGVPEHPRPRHEMRLEMVGVQLDQAGQQKVALAVDPAFRAAAFADLDDAAVVDRDPSREDAVGGDDLGVGQDEGVGGVEFHASGSVFIEERLGRQTAEVVERSAQRRVRPVPPGECVHARANAFREAGPQRSRRHADDDHVGRDVVRHHRAGADHRAVADRDAGGDRRAVADPDVVADGDALSRRQSKNSSSRSASGQ